MTLQAVSPAEIHSELNKIWESLEGSNKMRASLFNLIFFTKKNARAEYMKTVSQKVIEKFPSRVIFIQEDSENGEEFLKTSVSVQSSGEQGSDIACDYIQIDVAGSYIERVPFVLLPHILPDLPIYVIWSEDPSEYAPLFAKLQKLASRVIFDSEAVTNLSEFAKSLIETKQTSDVEIADLNWARMQSWRELLASTFYTEERLSKLHEASKVQIVFNAKESPSYCHTLIQSLYLQGWLGSQLGWTLQNSERKEGSHTFHYEKENGHVEVSLYPESNEKLKPGIILSVDIETEQQDHFSFGRNLDIPHHVSMRFSTLEKCDIPLRYIFAKDESGASLVSEVCQRGTSNHFLHLLEKIQEHKEYSSYEY